MVARVFLANFGVIWIACLERAQAAWLSAQTTSLPGGQSMAWALRRPSWIGRNPAS